LFAGTYATKLIVGSSKHLPSDGSKGSNSNLSGKHRLPVGYDRVKFVQKEQNILFAQNVCTYTQV